MTSQELIDSMRVRGFASGTVSDANAAILVDETLRLYNHYRPQIASAALTTVVRQQTYTPAVGCMKVTDVFWFPNDDDGIMESIMIDVELALVDFNYPSLLKIFFAKKSSLEDTTRGNWKWDGQYIWLEPYPELAGDRVPYLYTKKWSTINDVPAADEELIVDAMEALATKNVAQSRVGSSGWRAGAYAVDAAGARAELDFSKDLYRDICIRLAGGAIATRS